MPKLTYLGHSGFIIENEQTRLVIDPFLTGNPLAKMDPSQIKADYILVSHGHGDHLGDSIDIARKNNAQILATYELATYCQSQGAEVHPMHIGGAYRFPFGRVKLTIAHHGSSTPDGAYMGEPAGFLITLDEKTVYHAGDTGLFLDMKLIGELDKIDVALLPIGDNFTMGVDDALMAAQFLKAQLSIPMHYNTFPLIEADPQQFLHRLSQNSMAGALLDVNESIEF